MRSRTPWPLAEREVHLRAVAQTPAGLWRLLDHAALLLLRRLDVGDLAQPALARLDLRLGRGELHADHVRHHAGGLQGRWRWRSGAADNLAPPGAPTPGAVARSGGRTRVLLNGPDRRVVGGVDLRAAVVAPAVPAAAERLEVGPFAFLERHRVAHGVRRVGAGAEGVARVREVVRLEFGEAHEDVVGRIDRQGREGI